MPVVKIILADIIEYLSGKSRPVVEGVAVFNANHIILCEVEDVESRRIFGLCLQSSALKSPPHEIKLNLGSVGTSVTEWICICSCKAGQSGFCKHVVALLLYVNRIEVLDDLSCTDVKQVWGKEKKKMEAVYAAERAVDYWHFQKRKRCQAYDEKFKGSTSSVSNDNLSLRDQIRQSMKASEFMTTLNVDEGWYPQNACCRKILFDLGKEDIVNALMCEQGSKEWRDLRKLRLTGTSIYSMYTYGKTNFEQKAKSLFWPKGFSNKYIEHGKRYEGNAIQSFQNKYPEKSVVTAGFLISETYPWLGYSPDGIVFKEGKLNALLEIKCPFLGRSHSHNDENFRESCDYLKYAGNQTLEMKQKHKYYGQMQLGMAIAGVQNTFLIVYSPFSDSFLEILVEFNESFSRELMSKSSEKYLKYILHEYCKNKDSFPN